MKPKKDKFSEFVSQCKWDRRGFDDETITDAIQM